MQLQLGLVYERTIVKPKNPDYEIKRATLIRNKRRSGLNNPDYSKNFIKNNIRNHAYLQFLPN